MTPGCQVWVQDALERDQSIAGEVLEVGSLDVNGTIRQQFSDHTRFPSYIGLDMRPGDGVDVQARGDALPFVDERFAVVVALEMLEHDSCFWHTLQETHRVLRLGGWLMLTTRAFGFPRHDYPHDYWRFTAEGVRVALGWAGFQYVDAVEDRDDLGVYVVARRVGNARAWCPPPPQPVLLPEAEVAVLGARMRSLIPMGVTSLADAFERVDSDRRLLLGLVRAVWLDPGSRALVPGLLGRIGRTIGEDDGAREE